MVQTLRWHTSSLAVKGFTRGLGARVGKFPMLFDVLALCYHGVAVRTMETHQA
jgi:hypothetical protein